MVTDPAAISPPVPAPPTYPVSDVFGGVDPTVDLFHHLGAFDVQTLAHSGYALIESKKLWMGGFLGLAIALRISRAFVRHLVDENQDPRWAQELLACFFWTGVVLCFTWWSSELMYYVTHIVGKPPEASSVSELYYARMDKLQQHKDAHTLMSADYWASVVLRVATAFAFLAVQVVTYMLNVGQSFGLVCLLIFGRVVLSLAAIGGFFGTFGIAWLMFFIELCLWSPVMRLLVHAFGSYAQKVPQDGDSLVLELVICWVYYQFMREIPKFAAALVQGGGAGWMDPGGGVAVAGTSGWGVRGLGKRAMAEATKVGKKAWAQANTARPTDKQGRD